MSSTRSRAICLRARSAVELGGRARPDPGQGSCSAARGQLGRRAAGKQLAQQGVQLVDAAGALLGQVGPAFVEHPQHRRHALGDHRSGIAVQRGDAGRRGGIERVGLPPPASGQLPHPGGRGGRDIDHVLAPRDQPLREVPAQALGVLHRPPPLIEPLRPAQQPPVLRETRLDPQPVGELMRLRIQCRGGVAGLVGVDADHDHRCVLFSRGSGRRTVVDTPTSSSARSHLCRVRPRPAPHRATNPRRANPRIGRQEAHERAQHDASGRLRPVII
jgi:hypothetical protein